MEEKNFNCVICNTKFISKCNTAKYCPDCRLNKVKEWNKSKYERLHKRHEKIKIICSICDTEFESTHLNAKYCSEECRKKAHVTRQNRYIDKKLNERKEV